jgi:serine/threonine protein kinase
MLSSLPFLPKGEQAPTRQDGSKTSSREAGEVDAVLGDYINTCIKGNIYRSVIGNSDKMRCVGEGTTYRVYQAKILNRVKVDTASPKYALCAVKMLRGTPLNEDHRNYASKLSFQKTQLQAIHREVAVLCHPPLQAHENIIKLLEFGFNTQGNEDEKDEDWQSKQPFIVLEYAHQKSLKDFLASALSKDVELRRELALDMTAGLEALHRCDVIHGDLKTDNLLVLTHPDRTYCAKLSDFGHSTVGRESASYRGTKRYLPPEIRSAGEVLVIEHNELTKCDIWALGAALFEIMRGVYFGSLETSKSDSDYPTTDEILNDEGLGAQLSILDGKSWDLWISALRLALQTDPAQRGTAQEIRVILDVNHRQIEFQGYAVDKAPLTVFEVLVLPAHCHLVSLTHAIDTSKMPCFR